MYNDRSFSWKELSLIFSPYVGEDSIRYCIRKFVTFEDNRRKSHPYEKEDMITIYAYIIFKKNKKNLKPYQHSEIIKFIKKNGYVNFKICFDKRRAIITTEINRKINEKKYEHINVMAKNLYSKMNKEFDLE